MMFWSRSFAMRMTNRVLPCEMFASSGEGVALPTRLRFSELPRAHDPAQRIRAERSRRFQPRGR